MKLYTKTGDDGTTGLYGGERVSKADSRVDAYGTVDELNAALGFARALGLSPSTDATLHQLQQELFVIGAELACTPGKEEKLGCTPIDDNAVYAQERAIDAATAELEPLRTFILPGGTLGAAALHVARTIARRAERQVVGAGEDSEIREEVVRYLNRTSDLLFVLARLENHRNATPDTPWAP